MGKLLAIVLLIIALASAYPIVTNMFELPKDISTHGHAIDEQILNALKQLQKMMSRNCHKNKRLLLSTLHTSSIHT